MYGQHLASWGEGERKEEGLDWPRRRGKLPGVMQSRQRDAKFLPEIPLLSTSPEDSRSVLRNFHRNAHRNTTSLAENLETTQILTGVSGTVTQWNSARQGRRGHPSCPHPQASPTNTEPPCQRSPLRDNVFRGTRLHGKTEKEEERMNTRFSVAVSPRGSGWGRQLGSGHDGIGGDSFFNLHRDTVGGCFIFLYLFALTIFCRTYGLFHYFTSDVCIIINVLFLKGLCREMNPWVGTTEGLLFGPMLLKTETIVLRGLRLTGSKSLMAARHQTSKKELTGLLRRRARDPEHVLLGKMM